MNNNVTWNQIKPKVIYVAGPFRGRTPWEVEQNVRRAEEISKVLWGLGVFNICPHTMGRFLDREVPDIVILEGTKEILRRCDAVFVLPNSAGSTGTQGEIAEANLLRMPVFYTIPEVVEYVQKPPL